MRTQISMMEKGPLHIGQHNGERTTPLFLPKWLVCSKGKFPFIPWVQKCGLSKCQFSNLNHVFVPVFILHPFCFQNWLLILKWTRKKSSRYEIVPFLPGGREGPGRHLEFSEAWLAWELQVPWESWKGLGGREWCQCSSCKGHHQASGFPANPAGKREGTSFCFPAALGEPSGSVHLDSVYLSNICLLPHLTEQPAPRLTAD